MGSEYKWSENPVRDTLLQMIIIGVDISEEEYKKEINEIFTILLEKYLREKEDLIYLDFEIKKSDTHFQLIGNNIISALWLSGILPKSPTNVMEANECHCNGNVYTFDKEKKILIITPRT